MKQIYNKRFKKVYVLLALLATQAHAYSIALFDPLFPETPFKKVIMRCMKVRSSAHLIMDHEGSIFDAELLYDCMIGRITQLTLAVDTIIENQHAYAHADLEYLCTIVEYMIADINNALHKHTNQEKADVTPLITAIKNKLECALDQA